MRLVHCLERRWLADSPPQLTQHRDINIRGIGYVASEIAKNHGIAICAPVAPYDVTRKEVRAVIEPLRGFVMVYLSTPVEMICERRYGKVFTRKRALEFSRTLLVFPTSMRNLRMRTLSSIPQRSRQKSGAGDPVIHGT